MTMKDTKHNTEPADQAQLDAIHSINTEYDSEARLLLQQAQQAYNQQLADERQNDHRDYTAIEAEAKRVLAEARKAGETHIVHRLRKSPLLFWSVGRRLNMWYNGEIRWLDISDPILNVRKFRAISAFVDGSKVLLWLVSEAPHTAMLAGLQFNHDSELIFHKQSFQANNIIWNVFGAATGFTVVLTDSEVAIDQNHFRPRSWSDGTKIKHAGIGYEPRMTVDEKALAVYYTFNNESINRVDGRGNNLDDHPEVLNKQHFDQVVDLAYDSATNSLLLQDAGKHEIGLHHLQKRKFASFGKWDDPSQTAHHLEIPSGALPSGKQFTVSFLLHAQNNAARKPSLSGPSVLNCWITTSDELSYHYINGDKLVSQTFSIQGQLQAINRAWFQVTWQKEGDQFRFYINAGLVHTAPAPDEIGLPGYYHLGEAVDTDPLTYVPIRLACPGYLMAELRFWNAVRTPEQLKQHAFTWLTGGKYEDLMGYWRLDGLEYAHVTADKMEIEPWPDLSGHQLHLAKPDVLQEESDSPFAAIIPLYEMKVVRQGVLVDSYAGKVYWVDEGTDGNFYMKAGSTLGHLEAIEMFRIDSMGPIALVSQTESPYDDLIMAHGRLRDAMYRAIMDFSDASRQTHQAVANAHARLDAQLSASIQAFNTHNKVARGDGQPPVDPTLETYEATHRHWLHMMDHMNLEQQNHLSALRQKEEAARTHAETITRTARDRASEIRATRIRNASGTSSR